MDQLSQYFGKAVEIVAIDGVVYKGNLKSIDGKQRKIVLKNIKDCTNGKQLRNEKHFYGDQIRDLKILEDVTVDEPQEKINRKASEEWMDASDQGPSLFQMGHLQPSLYMNGLEDTIDSLRLSSPPKATLIDNFDDSFIEACNDVMAQKVISMVFDGRTINRFGEISLLTIGTRNMIYLFDLHILGEDAFTNGLSSIIENQNILKVCHDVRMVSDCLQPKYNVQPINIFDTQVADAFIYKNENNQFPENVSSLTDCILNHLRLKEDDITFEYEKKKLIIEKKNILTNRPLNKEYQKICAMEAMYLRELRTIMMEKLLADFLHGVDIYLNDFREQSDNAVKYANLKKLPKQFKKFTTVHGKRGKFSQRRRHDDRNKHYEEEYDSDSSNPVMGTRRSAWDTGTNFSEKYHEKHGEIVESLGTSCSMIDHNKPLLRQTNSPKIEATIMNKSAKTSQVDPILNENEIKAATQGDLATKTIDWKSHVAKFQSREGQYDDFQFSTTSDSDDSYLYGSEVNYDMDEIEKLMQLELKRANNSTNDNKTSNSPSRPRIGSDAKRMIKHNLPKGCQLPVQSSSSSPPSLSINEKEYPSIQESVVFKSKKPKDFPLKKKDKVVEETNTLPKASPKPRGRGQILKSLTEKSRLKTPSPGLSEIGQSRPHSIGDAHNVYDFPSDEELLDTPHVLPEVDGTRIVGENVSVLKKHNK